MNFEKLVHALYWNIYKQKLDVIVFWIAVIFVIWVLIGIKKTRPGRLMNMMLLAVSVFGGDVCGGASQISLLLATAIAAVMARTVGRKSWKDVENGIVKAVSNVTVSVLILLLIGMLSGAWMVSGVVPTIIVYGVQVVRPGFFLVAAAIVSAVVALVTGTSWSTCATIGVALMGIGSTLGIPPAWSAGAIISGAYFGDKLSPLSDTTILASSSTGVELFSHVRYMLRTTVPTFLIAIAVFAVVGCTMATGTENAEKCVAGLSSVFAITPWALVIPLATLTLIALRVPTLAVLFASALLAGGFALVFQRPILLSIAGDSAPSAIGLYKAVMTVFFGSTGVETGNELLNRLVATRGMAGMLDTVWLILIAAAFGGVMYVGGMLRTIAQLVVACVRGTLGLVGATAFMGTLMNVAMGDQYLAILVTADVFRDVYRSKGYEPRLLSRTIEDSCTVTSVLVPWNTFAMAQSASLGVATLGYLPYCFFNLLSPLVTVCVAAIGWGVVRGRTEAGRGARALSAERAGRS